ncbi:uncharacterized protein LOC131001628 [Salvia miltiorrhiza]|uniref:uncharacterized protein LOC131001628 n=1 Tax=Salvia miltiorrhiza TaxID=226208 RepID=UPI0025ABAAF1|nr:uncharacterized protein LOC131001628 [Salvia miltiorrhiza]
MAATDVTQVGINFEGQHYVDSFPKLEKRGRIPKRQRPSTAAPQEKLGEQQILVEDHCCRESTHVEEETAVADQEEEHQKSNDEEKELENVGFDEHHKSDEAPQEEKDWVVTATQEIPLKSVEEGNPAEETETSTNEEDDYLFFGTFRSLIRIAAGNQEEREAPVEESNDGAHEREIIQQNKMEDVCVDEQQKSDAQIMTSSQESTQQEEEGVVSQLPNYVENPHKPTTDVEEKEISDSEVQKSTTDVVEGGAQEKQTTDMEEKEGGAQEKQTTDVEEKEGGAQADERETTDPEVVASGETENKESDSAAAAVEETPLQKIDAREEEMSFGGKNYDDHFPKIERKQRITKRERRGEFQN